MPARLIVYRMHRPGSDVFDTTGAFLNEGRWHSAGTRLVYTAEHASLAVLETLIHAGSGKLPARVLTRIVVPDSCSLEQAPWMEKPESQRFGDLWVRENRSAILAVPSIAVNKIERNFLLNPAHADFSSITHDDPEDFHFDSRLWPVR